MRQHLSFGISIIILLSSNTHSVLATEYKFCVSCDNHRASVKVTSGAPDLGKEWYRVKTGMLFTKAYHSQSCSVSDHDPSRCDSSKFEELTYTSVSGDQIEAVLSGNPVVIGQTIVEVITGFPAAIYGFVSGWFKR